MISLVKTVVILIAFFFFLTIEVKDKPIFSHIYGIISPATKTVQNATEDLIEKSVDNTQSFSKKLFDNSVPKVKDSVRSKQASLKKRMVAEPAERITEKEKEELNSLIKNH